ncbi:MAG: L-threonylcarbamoyladenylate synthase [Patescibacteria group bacterium]
MLTRKRVIEIIKSGGIGIMPTDTIYGLVGLALDKKAVERIYQVRQRKPDRPLIILIGSLSDLKLFGVDIDSKTKEVLATYWPGAVSVVLPCKYKKFEYLHRGAKTLAFRWPKGFALEETLLKTGPLVAPSANLEGREPAKNINEAKNYFLDSVDFYYGHKDLVSLPSTLIKIENGEILVLRQGAVAIKNKRPADVGDIG